MSAPNEYREIQALKNVIPLLFYGAGHFNAKQMPSVSEIFQKAYDECSQIVNDQSLAVKANDEKNRQIKASIEKLRDAVDSLSESMGLPCDYWQHPS